jgi:trk system potassium uptake protein
MRLDRALVRAYRLAISHIGLLLMMGGALALTPLTLLLFVPAEAVYARPFVEMGVALGLVGGVARRMQPRVQGPTARPSIDLAPVVVVVSWLIVVLISAWPFATVLGASGVHAIFESMSAWTTTGLSVVDVERAPKIILLWRSTMQLAGGAGMAVLTLAVIGRSMGTGLAFAEGRSDKLAPSVRRSARLVVTLYGAYAVIGIAAYLLAGMPVFDAVNHTFCAISTGGFSTHPDSIGHFQSLAVELVTIPLMLAGSVNFAIVMGLAARKARLAESREMRLLVVLVVLVVAVVAWQLPPMPLLARLRLAAFEAVSALTTTGFSTTSYAGWTQLSWFALIAVMAIGGQSGSTAGGLKQLRVVALLAILRDQVVRAVGPRRAVLRAPTNRADAVVTPEGLVSILSLYVLSLLVLAGIMVAYGVELRAALFEAASTLSTVGLSVGVTAADAPPAVLVAQTVGMLLGRLELLVVVVAVARLARDGVEVGKAVAARRLRPRRRRVSAAG